MKKNAQKPLIKAVTAALAAMMLVTAAVFLTCGLHTEVSAASVNDANVRKMQEQIAAYEAERKASLTALQEVRLTQSNTMEEKMTLDNLVTTTQKKIDMLNELSMSLEAEIAQNKLDIADAEARLAAKKETFRKRLVAAHEEGNVSYLEIIFDSSSLTDFLTRIDRVTTMLEYDQTLISQYEQEKLDLETARLALEQNEIELLETIALTESDMKELEARQTESENFLQKLAQDEAAWLAAANTAAQKTAELDQELEAYIREVQRKAEEERKRQQELLRQQQAAAAAAAAAAQQNNTGGSKNPPAVTEVPQYTTASGAYMWPLPTSWRSISSFFGPRGGVFVSGIENHGAIDVPASYGTSVYASNAGTVLIAESHYSYGNYVLIDHGDGKSTLYAHLSSILVSVGQSVSKGATIGRVGSTGFSSGNHLHFEVRINGTRVDPLGYVSVP